MAMSSSRTKTSSSPSLFYSHPLTCSYRLWLSTSPLSPPSSSTSSVNKPSITVTKKQRNNNNNNAVMTSSLSYKKMSCMCSPTTHAGSFRCAYHKSIAEQDETASCWRSNGSSRLNLRRSAMKSSLVRIGGAEGDEFVRKTLMSLIRSSSHQMRRRESFHLRLTRFSVVSKHLAAEQLVGIEQDPAKFTPTNTRFQRGSSSIRRKYRTHDMAATPIAGVSYVATPVMEEEELVDGDFYLLAKSYFDCREYKRAAHVLRDQTGRKSVFLRCYALYLVCYVPPALDLTCLSVVVQHFGLISCILVYVEQRKN
ncbi:unnamed protein product [Lupinus luteus]|uniref:Cdc23 domain-containing protein n=1 Tax=Lupinus luteus TaxID=3873 RepID=A0AAV1W3H6_LUPLU